MNIVIKIIKPMIIANVFRYPLKKTVLEVNSQKMIDIINSGSDEYSMETSNAIWIKKDYLLTIKYVSNAGAYYYGAIIPLDFVDEPEASRNSINNWAEKTRKHPSGAN